ncbi:retrotransposon protein [Cucumis melo var. makuwa]|nr:retrotransposon protein [Cucumis melo var. makuwa]
MALESLSVRTTNSGRLRSGLHAPLPMTTMLEPTSLDRALLQRHLFSRMDDMRGFIQMPDDERQTFCRVLLGDISR